MRSQRAQELGQSRQLLVKEHVIPLDVISRILAEQNKLQPLSIQEIGKILTHLTLFAIITKAEDKALSSAGLASKMPIGHLPRYPFYENRLARYQYVGIAINAAG